MKIEQVKIEELKPYPKNAKKHDKKQVAQIAKSIQEFGFNQPIVVDKNNVVIVGHGRLEAAKYLKMETVPTLTADLTEEKAKAYRLADNKLNESDWEMKLVIEELKELQIAGVDIEITGFDKDLLITQEERDDQVPENPPTVVKRGDIWKMGDHRLMCGDSTKLGDVEKLMDGKKADMVFTDPPYGISYKSNMRTKTEKFGVLDNDEKIITEWIPLAATFSDGFMFIWTTWKVLNEWNEATNPLGYLTNLIVWHKKGGGIGDLKHTFSTDYEMAMVFGRGAEITGKRVGSVWTIKKDFAGNYEHPTQKPVELAVEAIVNTTNGCDVVMDLFLGSGSTLIACEKTNRICFGMELDEHYCDVIIKRWEDYTGKKAEKIN